MGTRKEQVKVCANVLVKLGVNTKSRSSPKMRRIESERRGPKGKLEVKLSRSDWNSNLRTHLSLGCTNVRIRSKQCICDARFRLGTF